MSTSTTHCSSGRAAWWLPMVVRFQGITRTHHYSHKWLWSPRARSEILTAAHRTREALNPKPASDWLDGGEAVSSGAISGSCPASSGASGHQGADYFDLLKDIVKKPALAFQEDIVSVQIRLVLHEEHLDWVISGNPMCLNRLCPSEKDRAATTWLVWARKQNKSPSARGLLSTWAVLLFCHMCYLRRTRNIWICSGGAVI